MNRTKFVVPMCFKMSFSRFQDWMPNTGLVRIGNRALHVIKCVHEMQEASVMKQVASSVFRGKDDVEEVGKH